MNEKHSKLFFQFLDHKTANFIIPEKSFILRLIISEKCFSPLTLMGMSSFLRMFFIQVDGWTDEERRMNSVMWPEWGIFKQRMLRIRFAVTNTKVVNVNQKYLSSADSFFGRNFWKHYHFRDIFFISELDANIIIAEKCFVSKWMNEVWWVDEWLLMSRRMNCVTWSEWQNLNQRLWNILFSVTKLVTNTKVVSVNHKKLSSADSATDARKMVRTSSFRVSRNL